MPTPRGSKQRAVQPPRPLPQKRPADPDLDATFAQDTASSSSASSSPANGKRRAAQPAPPYHSEYDYDATAFAQHTATSSRPSRAAAPLPVGESSRDEQLLDLVMRKVDAKNAQLIDQLSKTSAAQQRVAQQLQAQLASRGTVPHQEAVHAAPAAEPTPVQAPPPPSPAPFQPQVPLQVTLTPPPPPISDVVRAAEAKTERLIRQTQDVYMSKLPNKTAFVATKGQSFQMGEIIDLFSTSSKSSSGWHAAACSDELHTNPAVAGMLGHVPTSFLQIQLRLAC